MYTVRWDCIQILESYRSLLWELFTISNAPISAVTTHSSSSSSKVPLLMGLAIGFRIRSANLTRVETSWARGRPTKAFTRLSFRPENHANRFSRMVSLTVYLACRWILPLFQLTQKRNHKDRIIETVRMIAKLAQKHTNKPVNLFIGGHSCVMSCLLYYPSSAHWPTSRRLCWMPLISLGAGIASLLYARLIESPEDLGSNIVLRDGYVFGSPRACDAKLASRVSYNLNKPINRGRQLWRVANRSPACFPLGDVVASEIDSLNSLLEWLF